MQPLLSSWLERLGESVAVPYSTSVNLVSVPATTRGENHRRACGTACTQDRHREGACTGPHRGLSGDSGAVPTA